MGLAVIPSLAQVCGRACLSSLITQYIIRWVDLRWLSGSFFLFRLERYRDNLLTRLQCSYSDEESASKDTQFDKFLISPEQGVAVVAVGSGCVLSQFRQWLT